MESHQTGKHYKKKVEEVQKMSFEDQKSLIGESEKEDERIARLESLAGKWRDLLADTVTATIDHLQKKQSQSAAEIAKDDDDEEDEQAMALLDDEDGEDVKSDDEDRPIYNPLNL